MKYPSKYLTVDNPNIGLLPAEGHPETPFGKFVPTPFDTSTSNVDPDIVHIQSKDMYLPHFSLRFVEGEFLRDAVFINTRDEGSELLGSCLFTRGGVNSFTTDRFNAVETSHGTQNFKFDPQNEYRHLCKARNPLRYLHISYAPGYLDELLPDNEAWAAELKEKIFRQERILGDRATPIAIAQDRALQNIFQCPIDGKLGVMMIETSVVQIILLQLHMLFNRKKSEASALSRRDEELAYGLKEYLTSTYLDDHTLCSLAKHFGTNTNKLMTLFKKIFGKSIFEYISELRMEHARTLLLDKEMIVCEVAREIGYKNPNHFSAAFKKRFGLSPTEIR